MADISASNWNEQDAANNSAAPNGLPKGAQPSALQPVITDTRGAVKRFWNRINAIYTTTGTAAALVIGFTQAPAAYVKGERIAFFPHVTNTGAMTLNLGTLGAKSILRKDGSELVAGDVAAGQFTEVVYDGAAFRIVNGGGANFDGNVTAGSFTGDGAALKNLNATELKSGTIHNDRMAGTYDFQTLNLSSTLNAGTVVINSTGQPTLTLRKGGVNAGTMYYDGSDNLVIRKYDAANGGTAQGYFRIDGNGVNDAKYNGSTIWHAGNDGSGTGLDADLLDGYHAADLYRDNASFSTTGNLTISNSAPVIDLVDTDTNTQNSRLIQNSNNFHIQAGTGTTWTTKVQLEHDSNTAYLKYDNVYLGADSQIRIASDGNISGSKWGNTWLSTYMDGRYAMAADSIVAGNGLSGGGNLTASRTITLGTPGNITNSTTNSVSTTSHTHALGFTAAEVYTGTSSNNTNYPIGTCLWAYRWEAAYISRAQTTTLRLGNDGSWFGRAGSNAALSGSWAHRGDNNGGSDAWGLYQRIS